MYQSVQEIVQVIQYVLAPGLMVSSSALLLLGFQNKFSNLANRFRALKQELRALDQKKDPSEIEKARLQTVRLQVHHLMRRASHVKNAILQTYGAIVCFAGTSILIFLNVAWSKTLAPWTIGVFIIGMFCLLLAAISMIRETRLFYLIISLEKDS